MPSAQKTRIFILNHETKETENEQTDFKEEEKITKNDEKETELDKKDKDVSLKNDENTSDLKQDNKDIENKDIKTALNKIINTLISNQNISDNSIILVKYSDNKYYEEVKKALGKLLNVEEINETLQQTAKLYQGIEVYEDDKLELQSLDTYSKRLIKDYKNAQIVEEIENKMTEEEATTYAKRVYEKLNYYAQDVENQAKESTELPIIQIPANPELTIYPTSESWYYIKNHQVYAYIKFKSSPKDYDFCYNGNINNMKKGKCS